MTRSDNERAQDETEAIRIRAQIASDLGRVIAEYQDALTKAAGGRSRFALLAILDATAAILETVIKHVHRQHPELVEKNGPAIAARLDVVLHPTRPVH